MYQPFLYIPNLLANLSTLTFTWIMEGKKGSTHHRGNDRYTSITFLLCIKSNVKVLPSLLNQVEVRGINWSKLSTFLLVPKHFGTYKSTHKKMVKSKQHAVVVDRVIWYTEYVFICYVVISLR